MADVNNPIVIIQSRLQALRTEKEKVDSEIESLTSEKKAIKYTLPIVMHELRMMKSSLDEKYRDLHTYDSAIAEIEATYGHIIYSADMFPTRS